MSDEILHYGVKGMRWGVRKSRDIKSKYPDAREIVTKKGHTVLVTANKQGLIAKGLSKVSKYVREEQGKSRIMSIRDTNGKKIGNLQTYKVSKDELNLVWMDVNKNQRGKGIATAIIDTAVREAKKEGVKKLTLEVPGNSKDARHIYEKAGFKATEVLSKNDDVWGGLTKMEMEIKQSEGWDDILKHHGVKGMKWGVRRDKKSTSGGQKKTKPKTSMKDSLASRQSKIHNKRMSKNARYNKDYSFYREIGYSHANARKYASREVTGRYVHRGAQILNAYETVRFFSGR